MKWEHDILASDLANHLRANTDAIIWEDMQMGSSGSPRPDCYRIAKSYAKFQPIAYEITVASAVTDAAYRLANDNEVRSLRNRVRSIQRILEEASKPLPGEIAL